MSKFTPSPDFAIDHVGIAVNSLDEGGAFFKALGLTESGRETVASEKVNVAFYPLSNDCAIELIEPMNDDSTIKKFIEKKGTGLQQLCIRVRNIEAVVQRLKEHNIQLINDVPRPGAHNCRVVFVHPKSTGGVLIELSELAK